MLRALCTVSPVVAFQTSQPCPVSRGPVKEAKRPATVTTLQAEEAGFNPSLPTTCFLGSFSPPRPQPLSFLLFV